MTLLTRAFETIADASKVAWRDVLINRAVGHAITGAAIWGTWNWAQGGSFWTGALQGGLVGAGVGAARALNTSLASGLSELAETEAARMAATSKLTQAELRDVLGKNFDVGRINLEDIQRRLTPEAFSEWSRRRFGGMFGGIGGFLGVHGSAAAVNLADLTPELAAQRIGALYRAQAIREAAARSASGAAAQTAQAAQAAQAAAAVVAGAPAP